MKQTAATQNTVLRIELDSDVNLWYNARMATTVETTSERIIPHGLYSEHAFAFGYLRGMVQSLFAVANTAYYLSSEDRVNELENEIRRIEITLKKMESEMYPNDSE